MRLAGLNAENGMAEWPSVFGRPKRIIQELQNAAAE